jgi:hypothetical protein
MKDSLSFEQTGRACRRGLARATLVTGITLAFASVASVQERVE